jgi:hypothetical protein
MCNVFHENSLTSSVDKWQRPTDVRARASFQLSRLPLPRGCLDQNVPLVPNRERSRIQSIPAAWFASPTNPTAASAPAVHLARPFWPEISTNARLFCDAIHIWDDKQYSRIWCLSTKYHYILYLKELTGLMRFARLNFPQRSGRGNCTVSTGLVSGHHRFWVFRQFPILVRRWHDDIDVLKNLFGRDSRRSVRRLHEVIPGFSAMFATQCVRKCQRHTKFLGSNQESCAIRLPFVRLHLASTLGGGNEFIIVVAGFWFEVTNIHPQNLQLLCIGWEFEMGDPIWGLVKQIFPELM